MNYFPLTDADREAIKKTLGIEDTKELFSDIPRNKSYYPLDKIPSALTEDKLSQKFREIAAKNQFSSYLSFLGGGAYQHFIPEVVNYLSGKGEFLTPYTPYQAEVSQGSLQGIFEYQTMMAQLTGMDVANASLYDGGTAALEALLLALRKSKKNKVLIASTLHPETIEIIQTYIQNLNIEAEVVHHDVLTGKIDLNDLEKKLNENIGGFLFQSPNFLGVVEDAETLSSLVHQNRAFSIQIITEALSLGFLKSPGETNQDIVAGEAQSFGLPLSYGGPFLGFIAAKKEFLRSMPGRIVGETVDTKGNRGYVLTLSTREQHIKREKATSNICTNQAWCAIRAAIYLSTMGEKGLLEIARTNHLNTAYFVNQVANFKAVSIRYKRNFFNEVVLEIKNGSADQFLKELEAKKILAGIPLKWFYPEMDNAILINFTECHTQTEIDRLIKTIGELV